jgi:SlyX protein
MVAMKDDSDLVGRLESRLTSLESTLAHHQREYEVLNQVVIDQSGEIEKLQRRLGRLEAMLHDVRQHLPNQRDLEDEKPPHY